MVSPFQVSPEKLTLSVIKDIILQQRKLSLSAESAGRIRRCRDYLDRKLERSDELFYGINTGFGALCNVRISEEQIMELQENLVLSHAAGTGEEAAPLVARLMLLLKIHALALGHSGISPDTAGRLIAFYNEDLLPVIYQQGSLGASGDLAPLAHLALPLIGRGEVYDRAERKDAATALKERGWKALKLHSKEGLALLNGTQFMAACGISSLLDAGRLIAWADTIAALSLDAFDCRLEPFLPDTHLLRPHAGQLATATAIMKLLQGSRMAVQNKNQVQDPYSFRCIPQVHGATKDCFDFVKGVLETEINSVTDNPIIFPEEDRIISGGNFHGQPLALAADYLSVAVAELGSISERRTYLLLSGQRGLPPFLAVDPGLHSGLMIAQYTAASIVSQNKQLCTPASVDSITSSNGQEDHVSMGANAATRLLKLICNVERILAIELLTAAQAMEFRRPLQTSPELENLLRNYREKISFMKSDRELWRDIQISEAFMADHPAGKP